MTLLMMSCGKDNRTGGSIPIPAPGTIPVSQLGIQTLNAQQANSLNVVLNETPCFSGAQRIKVDIPVNINAALGQAYVGSTPEGDVAVIHNPNGTPVFTAFICQRPDLGGNGQLGYQIAVNASQQCAIDEITAATMWIQSSVQGVQPYQLAFRPIYFDGSSLCSGNQYPY